MKAYDGNQQKSNFTALAIFENINNHVGSSKNTELYR